MVTFYQDRSIQHDPLKKNMAAVVVVVVVGGGGWVGGAGGRGAYFPSISV